MRMRSYFFALGVLLLACGVAHADYLFWTSINYGAPTLNRANDNGSGIVTSALGVGTLPEGLAVDPTFAKVYWAEAAWSGARINQAWYDLSSQSAVLTGGSAYRGLALDAVDDKLYWTSSNLTLGGRIHRANQNGTNPQVLLTLAAPSNPRGIVVDHAAGLIYWAEFDQCTIRRSNLDGSGLITVVSRPLGSAPYGLALDPGTQLLYWTEYGSGTLMRATTTGANLTTLYTLLTPTYLALDLVGSRIFWIDGVPGNQKIRRGPLAGGSPTTVTTVGTYGGLAYVTGGTTSTPETDAPLAFAIERVWPSPSTGPVHIAFTLPHEAEARLSVLDLQGREIAVLAQGVMPAGRHEPVWNPARATHAARAGVYFVRLVSEGRSIVRRVALAN
jgi:DNA-binding beta-propeller fold protein YncE